MGYNYCSNGTSQCSTGNTGSPFQHTIAAGGQTQATQEYQHDALNRLALVSEHAGSGTFNLTCPDSGSTWCRQFSYDNSGNRTVPERSPAGSNTWDAGTFNTKNQVADPGWAYDNAGNVIQSPLGQAMKYDGEGRLVSFCSDSSCTQQTQFVYDAAGNRVQRTDSTSTTTSTTTFVYDAFGNLTAEYGGTPSATGTQYVTVDALGSTRLVMQGTQASERHDFQPYGEELTTAAGTAGPWRTAALGYGTDTERQKFTGQERDVESGLDFFQARYYSAVQGRFGSPDPGNAGANPGDPQSWNGYAYVSGNPLTYTDPSGMDAVSSGAAAGGIACGAPCAAVGAGIGAIVDALILLDIFGGGSKPDLSSVAWTPGPVQPLGGGPGSPQFPGSNSFAPCSQTLNGCPPPARSAFWSTAGYFFNWVTGTGPRFRYYGPRDFRTLDFVKSSGFQTNMMNIAAACRVGITSGPIELSTADGGYNLRHDIPNSPVGAEVGGYAGGQWAANGSEINITIPNDSGTKSFFYGKAPNSPLPFGPMRTIHQTFVIKVPNPCSKK